MPFIGQQPTTGAFIQLDSLTASATANYTLQLNGANYEPESVNNLLVSINGVIQGSNTMSLSGSTLTVGATLSSSDVIDFVRVFGNVGTISTPTDGSVTVNKLGTGAVTNAKIADSTIDLTSKVTGVLPVANSQTNTSVMFHAYHTSVANQAGVLTGLNNENNFIYKGDLTSINTNNVYNTSNGRFTPGVAGKYWCYATMSPASATSGFERTIVRFLKNGTKYPASTSEFDTTFSQDSAEPTSLPCHISMIVDLNATDYLECQVFHDCESVFWEFKSNNCHFGGYKLIGA